MLTLADDRSPYRIVGIDPGTDTLGVSVIDVDLDTLQISVMDSMTLHGSRMISGIQRIADTYGSRFARLMALEEALIEYFFLHKPHAIISESPYFNARRPQAYGALVEAMGMLKRAVFAYNPTIPLFKVDPASNKANLRVSGKSGDKELMKSAVVNLAEIRNPTKIVLQLLDEHSIDSLSVAYYHACTVLNQIQNSAVPQSFSIRR